MSAETTYVYNTTAQTGTINFLVDNAVVSSHSYANGEVEVSARSLTTLTFDEWVAVVADARLWQAGLRHRFPIPEGAPGAWRSNLYSTPSKVQFTFKAGNEGLMDGEWTKNTNMVTLQPRRAVTVSIAEWDRWFAEIERYQNEVRPYRQ